MSDAALAARIADNSVPVTECGCWLWTGALSNTGYGSIRIGRRMIKAHRASWVAYRGPIQNGVKVLHQCDVRSCVNPDHLFVGSQKDNVYDMIGKGRAVWQSGVRLQRRRFKNNKSGATGVAKSPYGFVAYIYINKKRIHLGSFRTFEQAKAAREKANV